VNPPPVLRLVVRNFFASLHPITLLLSFGQPAFLLVVLGTMFGQIVPSVGGGGSYVAFLVPGIVAFQIVTGGVLAANLFFLDRRWGMVEQILSGPFFRAEYLASLLLTSLLLAFAGVGIMLVVALPLIGVPTLSPLGAATVLLAIGAGSAFYGALLIAVGSRLRSSSVYFAIQSVFQYFLIFVSTVYYPLTARTPAGLALAVRANPLTYAADTVRDAFRNSLGTNDVLALAALILLALLAFAVAVLGVRGLELGPLQ
jgi:ABC-2 type transport system permease protein